MSEFGEPWAVVNGSIPGIREIKGPAFSISIVMEACDITPEGTMQREADAQRICACMNALSGISDPAAFVAAARGVVAAGSMTTWTRQVAIEDALRRLEEAGR